VIVYHATTPRKLYRYGRTGAILPPVFFWTSRYRAVRWARSHNRPVVLSFTRPEMAHPLPYPQGGAMWSPNLIYQWNREDIHV